VSSDHYGSVAGEIADSGGNPMFDRMTDGEIAHYFEDRDREPAEPNWDAIEYAKHCHDEHDGKACDCPLPTPEETEAAWAERARQHVAEDHGGGECDCVAPY
jgi:hypothetical protein